MIKRILRFLKRNRSSLCDKKTIPHKVNLEWWSRKDNVGDHLAVVIYDWITDYYNLDVNAQTSKTHHLLTVGSLIGMEYFDATIWGSGVHCLSTIRQIGKQSAYRKYDIRAVRGPLTRAFLIEGGYECPEIYGDPAILMPLIYSPEKTEKKYDVSVIRHLSKRDAPKKDGIHYIDIQTKDHTSVINEICSSKRIISSSLHGIILAETYGVPAVFLNDGMDKELYKFLDWYYSTNRYAVVIANNLEEAENIQPMPLPDLQAMQKGLLDTFPVDLWSN